MLRGVHIISQLLRGFHKTSSLQLQVQRILKTKTRCAYVLNAQNRKNNLQKSYLQIKKQQDTYELQVKLGTDHLFTGFKAWTKVRLLVLVVKLQNKGTADISKGNNITNKLRVMYLEC